MKKTIIKKKLVISAATLRQLTAPDCARANGGATLLSCTVCSDPCVTDTCGVRCTGAC